MFTFDQLLDKKTKAFIHVSRLKNDGAMAMMAPAHGVRKIDVIVGLLLLGYIVIVTCLWIRNMPSPSLPAGCYGPVMCSEKECYANMMTVYLLLGLAAIVGVPAAVLRVLENLEYRQAPRQEA
jgi:hypothetical protein